MPGSPPAEAAQHVWSSFRLSRATSGDNHQREPLPRRTQRTLGFRHRFQVVVPVVARPRFGQDAFGVRHPPETKEATFGKVAVGICPAEYVAIGAALAVGAARFLYQGGRQAAGETITREGNRADWMKHVASACYEAVGDARHSAGVLVTFLKEYRRLVLNVEERVMVRSEGYSGCSIYVLIVWRAPRRGVGENVASFERPGLMDALAAVVDVVVDGAGVCVPDAVAVLHSFFRRFGSRGSLTANHRVLDREVCSFN